MAIVGVNVRRFLRGRQLGPIWTPEYDSLPYSAQLPLYEEQVQGEAEFAFWFRHNAIMQIRGCMGVSTELDSKTQIRKVKKVLDYTLEHNYPWEDQDALLQTKYRQHG